MSSCLEKGQVSCHLQAYDPVEVSYWGLATAWATWLNLRSL
jgi:hypothetical protein